MRGRDVLDSLEAGDLNGEHEVEDFLGDKALVSKYAVSGAVAQPG
jgi:hypothetical protein